MFDPDKLVGASIDIFDLPGEARRALTSAATLPWRGKFKLGQETIDLKISAVKDVPGVYVTAAITWWVYTEMAKAIEVMQAFQKTVTNVSAACAQMREAAAGMNRAAEESTLEANSAAQSAERASTNVQTVSSAAEEMATSCAKSRAKSPIPRASRRTPLSPPAKPTASCRRSPPPPKRSARS